MPDIPPSREQRIETLTARVQREGMTPVRMREHVLERSRWAAGTRPN